LLFHEEPPSLLLDQSNYTSKKEESSLDYKIKKGPMALFVK